MPQRSIVVLGFSEGGELAPYIARDSKKIGRLATAGSGGLQQREEFRTFADRGVAPYAKPFSRQYFIAGLPAWIKPRFSNRRTCGAICVLTAHFRPVLLLFVANSPLFAPHSQQN